MAATLAVTARTAAATVALARQAGEDSVAVAWGVVGACPDGYTILAADAGRLAAHVAFARGRVGGKAGHRVVWGRCDDVHAAIYGPR